LCAVGFGVGVGGGEESEEGILHGGLLSSESGGDEESCGDKAGSDGDSHGMMITGRG
jgi:hypothetical protein